ncbi:MAG: pyridoxine biosynthesis protein [Pycnora praestabilis]|nr:MAG: pyridoxine biosynthesis protein [Pycnora praestabilis]
MPALSPTMTEGNITSWKVKEGDSFSAGDVILEVETDKAQMDVEAQDDGVMAKIMLGNGSKAVKVGTRIGVIAESDDDLSNLSLPGEDSQSAPSPQDETASGIDPSQSSESQAEAPPLSKTIEQSSTAIEQSKSTKTGSTSSQQDETSFKPSADSTTEGKSSESGKPRQKKYPLYPSVQHLLHEKGIPGTEIEKIPASGPAGRLLKGDVLAYLGQIASSYSSDQSARISNLGHLDLSKIKVMPQTTEIAAPAPQQATKALPPTSEPDTEVAVPVSLTAVLAMQKRVQDTLGVMLPLSTFIARATDVANDDLPKSKLAKPSCDELFNQVLGLDNVNSPATSRGSFTPQITALPSSPLPLMKPKAAAAKKPDIIDMLSGKPSSVGRINRRSSSGIMGGSSSSMNVFSVSVPKGEEKRARKFLERVKTVLEAEPGRLVI